ncbi:MAG TPA: murein biosynthesis integral membrane protein MurJ, partial [Spirochaetia bacterium]|nr:murein biosynthesis integral membrane protein MurJ [Spirochaetia bacterium]
MGCTTLTRIMGFVRMFVFAYFFGNTATADVINAVFHIPNSLRMLFAEGALSSAFIPALSSSLVADPTGERARRIVRNLFGFIIVLLIPLLGAATLFSAQVVGTLIPFKDPDSQALAAELFRWISWYLFFISLSAILMGALNAKQRFVVPAIVPLLFSVTVILSLTLLPIPLEYRMVAGILTGGVAQVLMQVPAFFRARYSLMPSFRFKNPEFLKILAQWVPVVLSASIFSINQLFANFFAAGLAKGSVSALQYAVVYFQLPLGIFANSVIIVMFPRMSSQVAREDRSGLKESVRYGLRFILLLLVPSTLMLIFFGEDLISVTLQHGAFTREGTLLTAGVLSAFAVGLFASGALAFFQRLFYSMKDYIRPLVTAVVMLAVDVGFSLVLK